MEQKEKQMGQTGVEVTNVSIKIGKKELNLTVKEAKELKSVLNELFEKEVVKEVHHYSDRWWYQPYYNQPLSTWTVTCGDTSLTSSPETLIKSRPEDFVSTNTLFLSSVG